MYACEYAYMYACMYVIMYVCMYLCMYVCMCTHIYIYIYIYIYIQTSRRYPVPSQLPFFRFSFSLRGWCSLSCAGAHTRKTNKAGPTRSGPLEISRGKGRVQRGSRSRFLFTPTL